MVSINHLDLREAPRPGAARSSGAQAGELSVKVERESVWLDQIHVVSEDIVHEPLLAKTLDTDLGALVNAIVCQVGDEAVLVLMAGDMPCDPQQIARVRNAHGGAVKRLNSHQIKAICSCDAITAMFPVALAATMPTLMDASLQRFDVLYTRAGARTCFMKTNYAELKSATRATVTYALSPADWRVKAPLNKLKGRVEIGSKRKK